MENKIFTGEKFRNFIKYNNNPELLIMKLLKKINMLGTFKPFEELILKILSVLSKLKKKIFFRSDFKFFQLY